MTYTAPVSQMLLALQVVGLPADGQANGVSITDAKAIVEEAARFAADRIAPLNRVGDHNPAKLINGKVVTPPGWSDVYKDWCANGWNSLTGPERFEGQGLPFLMQVACTEMWNSACISFALCPLLTTGAIEAINAHASEELKQRYLPNMVSGEWSGTMNLTEPQAGSDLSQLRCRAVRHADGSYRITGNKIFITYGEHELTSNIIHLVLARLEDAPPGTKGISLFLVPKILPDGAPNDVRCHSLEHKLGIHGSPTCTMVYGDNGGAQAWLIGEENRGLNCMFTMMNNARVLVAVQGVALAERGLQAALAFARERRQGRAADGGNGLSPIINHPDVKRMLVEMGAKTAAARMLCLATASAIDLGEGGQALASLLTPLAKTYATDIAVEVTSLAIQIHGGMGFIEETGVAQFYRDARILPIYEGTNGIQAIDLVTRKLQLNNAETLADMVRATRNSLSAVIGDNAADQREAEMHALTQSLKHHGEMVALAAASPYARALATYVAAGYLAQAMIAARGDELESEASTNAHYLATIELPTAIAAARANLAGSHLILGAKLI